MRFTGNGITNCYPDQVEDFISITVLSTYAKERVGHQYVLSWSPRGAIPAATCSVPSSYSPGALDSRNAAYPPFGKAWRHENPHQLKSDAAAGKKGDPEVNHRLNSLFFSSGRLLSFSVEITQLFGGGPVHKVNRRPHYRTRCRAGRKHARSTRPGHPPPCVSHRLQRKRSRAF